MQLIPIHYKISKPVSNYKEIAEDAEALRRFIVKGQLKGYYNKAFVLAHAQVCETPMSFFVVAPEVVKEKMFADDVIINPEIVESQTYMELKGAEIKGSPETMKGNVFKIPNGIEYQEPCLSFPYRAPKRITRYNKIKVKYQIRSFFGMKTIEADLQGIASQIFQHGYDHTQGKNIYFESETPVKWWELIGKDKSKGGTSLDAPEGLGWERAKEKVSNPDKTIIDNET